MSVCVSQTEQETSLLLAWPHWEKHSGNPTARRFLCLLSSYSPPFWSDGGMTDQGTVGFSRCPRSCVVLPLTRAVLHRKSLCLLKADFGVGVGLQGSFFPSFKPLALLHKDLSRGALSRDAAGHSRTMS